MPKTLIEGDGEEDGREGHEHVERPHDELIQHALGVAGDQAERHAGGQRQRRPRRWPRRGDAVGVDDPAQHAPPEVVHPEGLPERGRAEGVVPGDLRRAARHDPRREGGGEGERADDEDPGEGDPAVPRRERAAERAAVTAVAPAGR